MRVVLALVLSCITVHQGLAVSMRSQVQSLVGKKLTSSLAIVTKINEVDENGRNALHHAVILGNLPLVEFFLANGVNTKAADKDGLIPLRYAERIATEQPSVSSMQIVSLVLENTYGLDALDESGWTAIVWSLMAGDYARVIELRDRGADVFADSRRSRGQHAAWAAEHLQDSRAIKIIAEGALKKYSGGWLENRQKKMIDLVANYLQDGRLQDDRFIKNFVERVPDWYYFEAVDRGYLKLAQAMVDRGVNPDTAKDRDGVSRVMRVAVAGQIEELQTLIANGAQIDSRILFLAISSGNPNLVEIILKDNAELAGNLLLDLMCGKIWIPDTIRTTIGDVLIGTSTDEGKQKIYQMLTKEVKESAVSLPPFATIAKLQHLKEAKGRHIYLSNSLFSVASSHKLVQELREMLPYADATTRMKWAVSLEDIELLKQALADGADINHRFGFRHKATVIDNLAWQLSKRPQEDVREIMALLLTHGADPNGVAGNSFGGDYPIQELIRAKDFEGVKTLLDHGADPNHLVTATYAGDRGIIEILISYGADVNSNRGKEETPLKTAARLGLADLVLRYHNLGAELDDHDRHRGSAFTQAARKGHLEIIKMLDDLGARTDIAGYYGKPIEVARRFGHDGIVKFLQDRNKLK